LAFGTVLLTVMTHTNDLFYAKKGIELFWVLNAFRSLVFYPLKMAWPQGLTAYYPFPPDIGGFYRFECFCAATVVILVAYLLFRLRRKAPYLWAAGLFYLITLLPVLGIVQTGSQAAADRYTYLASLGFFLPFSAGVAHLLSYRWAPYAGLAFLLSALLGLGTTRQIGTWRNSHELWVRVTRVYPAENPTAYSKLGVAYLKARKYNEAQEAFTRACALPPPTAGPYNGLGMAFLYKGRMADAILEFRYALKLDPHLNAARLNLWAIYDSLDRHEEALDQMVAALSIESDSPAIYGNLGKSYRSMKKFGEVRKAFDKALRLYRQDMDQNPVEPVYDLKTGEIYLSEGLNAKALGYLRKAWNLNITNPDLLQETGEDFEKAGEPGLAKQCRDKAHAMEAGRNTF